jgi:transaldolase
VWLDYLRRRMTRSGELATMVADGLRGTTCNPTIFEHVIAGSADYDNVLAEFAASSATDRQILDALVIRDVQDAADVFREIYDESDGVDGFVSVDVAPGLARSTNALIAEARRLWRVANRRNLMVKIPGTRAALPAIERCLRDGINVNVTLLYSVDQYCAAATTYMRALEARVLAGQPLDRVASAASIFVSPVDSEVDRRIDARGGDLTALRGLAAIANARLVYASYVDIAHSDRWMALDARGAKLQRPLWACTAARTSASSELAYVESLIATDTITSVPPRTLRALREDGVAAQTPFGDVSDARRIMTALARGGIDFADVSRVLEEGGIWRFNRSVDKLLRVIAHKRKILAGHPLNFFSYQMP